MKSGDTMLENAIEISRFALPILAVIILSLCLVALLRRKPQSLGAAKIINSLNGEKFNLIHRENSIGRHKNNDIVLNYPTVSRQHAVIYVGKEGWYIKPVKVGTPVFINEQRADGKQMLKTGDKITMGEVDLYFDNRLQGKVKNDGNTAKNN